MARSLFCGGWEQVPFLKSTDGWIIFTRLRYPILSNWIEFEVSKCVQLLHDPDLDPHVYIPIYIYIHSIILYVDIRWYSSILYTFPICTYMYNKYIHTHRYTYIYMYVYIYIYVYTYIYTYIHIYIYIYMCPYWPTYSRWTAGTLTMPSQWCWNPSSRVRSIRSRGSWGRLPSIENGDL